MSEFTAPVTPEPPDPASVRYGPWTWLAAPVVSLLLAAYLYGLTPANLCRPLRYSLDAFPAAADWVCG